jgi:hypothetical protein
MKAVCEIRIVKAGVNSAGLSPSAVQAAEPDVMFRKTEVLLAMILRPIGQVASVDAYPSILLHLFGVIEIAHTVGPGGYSGAKKRR